jgi:broad specificity phosphatase PhoE
MRLMTQLRTTIFFVRHGTVYNPRDIFYGCLPHSRLSAEGQKLVEGTAGFFKHRSLEAVYASPMLRAQQTARAIHAYHAKIPLRKSLFITEVHTPYDGVPMTEIITKNMDVYSGAPEKFEQPGDVIGRMLKFLAVVRKKYAGRSIVAVSHGDPIMFLSLWANRFPITVENKQRISTLIPGFQYPEPASITSLSFATTDKEELPSVGYQPAPG